MSGAGRLLSEEMRRAVGSILEAGFQMESEAFKTLVEKGREDSLRSLVDEVLKMASSAQPRPLFISADLVLKAAEQLDLATGPAVPVEEGLGHGRRFAEDRESRLERVPGSGWSLRILSCQRFLITGLGALATRSTPC